MTWFQGFDVAPVCPEFAKPTFDFPLVFYLSDHPRFLDSCQRIQQVQPATLQQGLVISGPHLFLLVCGGGCEYLYLHWLHWRHFTPEPAELCFALQLPWQFSRACRRTVTTTPASLAHCSSRARKVLMKTERAQQ